MQNAEITNLLTNQLVVIADNFKFLTFHLS